MLRGVRDCYSPPMRKVRTATCACLLMAAILTCFPVSAHADAGIPMLPVRYPSLLLYLFPVVAIEAIYLCCHLKTMWRRTLIAVAGVNMVTMALGYPLTWAIYRGLDWGLSLPPYMSDIFNQIGWLPVWLYARLLPQWTSMQQAIWGILGIYVVLLGPGFLLSGVVKVWMVEGYDLLNYRGSTRARVWAANRLSNLFLAVTGCAILYMTYAHQ